ncbi:MAG: leucine-rich repeat domain-containing protein [Candidatus Nitrospinota bacterium M3_3B_026]
MKLARFAVSLILSLIVIISWTSGCGDSPNGSVKNTASNLQSPKAKTNARLVTGRVFKGPVSGGTVTVFSLNDDGSRGSALAVTTTGADGYFSFSQEFPFPVIFVATGGAFVDEASGELLEIPSDIEITTILTSVNLGDEVAITPMTYMASMQTLSRINYGEGLYTAITNAHNDVAHVFDLDFDIARVIPMDLTDPNETADLPPGSMIADSTGNNSPVYQAFQYGLVLSAISQFINEQTQGNSQQRNYGLSKDIYNYFMDTDIYDWFRLFFCVANFGECPSHRSIGNGSGGGNAVTLSNVVDRLYTGLGNSAANFLSGARNNSNKSADQAKVSANKSGWRGGSSGGSNGGGNSGGGGGGNVSPPQSAPGNISVSLCSQSATISWSEVSGAAYYNIYWSNSPDVSPATSAKISNVSSPYTVNDLSNGATYYYVVTGANDGGEGPTSSAASATPTGVRLFTDPAFEECVRAAAGGIDLDSLSLLTSLDCSKRSISSLSGAENLVNLVNFDLSLNVIVDVSPLSALTSLKNLDLRSNEIEDVTSLSALTKMETLDLSYNKIWAGVDSLANVQYANPTLFDLRENFQFYFGYPEQSIHCDHLQSLIDSVTAQGGEVLPGAIDPGNNCAPNGCWFCPYF